MATTLQDAPPAIAAPAYPAYPGAKAYLCHCLRVTEQDVRAAVDAGAVNEVRDAMQQTGAGTGCMACRCSLRDLIEDCQRRRAEGFESVESDRPMLAPAMA